MRVCVQETSWGVPDEVADSKRRAAEAEAVRAAEERAQQQAKLAVMRQQVLLCTYTHTHRDTHRLRHMGHMR